MVELKKKDFSRRHYEAIARVLSQVEEGEVKTEIVDRLAIAFSGDNPRFNRTLFVFACYSFKTRG